ncbi:MAG: zf-HC2 domain-containing protein [Oscillospiraceae bacterium]|nr:zf-HC2 domain-containing protein [Oscillospiraceae bacterium]
MKKAQVLEEEYFTTSWCFERRVLKVKVLCGIIKDLFPLYLDGVCSNDSKAAIEEHIAVCDSCKADLQTMKKPLPIDVTAQNLSEAQTVKNLSKRWKKGMVKSLLKGVLFTILAIAVLALFLYIFVDVQSF